MKNKDYYVVGIGEALLDYFPNSDKEKKLETSNLGGAPTIFAYHAAQSGWTGMIISAIGRKPDGKEIKERIKNHHLKSCLKTIKIKGNHPSIVNVNYVKGDRNKAEYTIDPNSAWSEIPYSDRLSNIARKTKAVYFGTLASFCGQTSKATIDKFLDEVGKDKNCLRIYDVNQRVNPNNKKLYSKDLILEYIKKCNVLKVNLEELNDICDWEGIKALGEIKKCKELMAKYPLRYLILTMGEDGSSVFWRDKEHGNKIASSSLSMPLNVNNTVGAGDALAGAFIGEILRNKTPIHAHHFAVHRSAVVCEKGDSMPLDLGRYLSDNYAFISYAREDEFAVKYWFCRCFEERGIPFWIDQKRLRYGDNFSEEIENAIRNCEVFIFFYSKNAKNSEWVHKEVEKARKYDKHIIPILLDNLKDEPYDKDNVLYKESVARLLEEKERFDYSLSKLINDIEECLNPQPYKKSEV